MQNIWLFNIDQRYTLTATGICVMLCICGNLYIGIRNDPHKYKNKLVSTKLPPATTVENCDCSNTSSLFSHIIKFTSTSKTSPCLSILYRKAIEIYTHKNLRQNKRDLENGSHWRIRRTKIIARVYKPGLFTWTDQSESLNLSHHQYNNGDDSKFWEKIKSIIFIKRQNILIFKVFFSEAHNFVERYPVCWLFSDSRISLIPETNQKV